MNISGASTILSNPLGLSNNSSGNSNNSNNAIISTNTNTNINNHHFRPEVKQVNEEQIDQSHLVIMY